MEVWADMLGSVGVIIGAILIKVTGWTIADPIIAVLLGLWVLPRTLTLMSQAGHILMQGVPDGLDLEAVRSALLEHPGVAEIHDLHAWALGSKEPVLTVHVVAEEATAGRDALRIELVQMLSERFDIAHATLQVEAEPCHTEKVHA